MYGGFALLDHSLLGYYDIEHWHFRYLLWMEKFTKIVTRDTFIWYNYITGDLLHEYIAIEPDQ